MSDDRALPPPPMADDLVESDERLRLHWAVVPAGLAVFALLAAVQYVLTVLSTGAPPRYPTVVIAPAIFMIGGAYLVDHFLPGVSLVGRWGIGMGAGAFLSFGGVSVLPAICCSASGKIGWMPLLLVSVLLGAMGTIAGVMTAIAARADRGRAVRMMVAPAVAVVPFMAFTPWLYMVTQSGYTPLPAWLAANYRSLWVAATAGLAWSAMVGSVAAFGLWMTERRGR